MTNRKLFRHAKGFGLCGLAVLLAALAGCEWGDRDDSTHQTVIIGGPSGTPTPVASPSPGATGDAPLPAGSYVRVGIFGYGCSPAPNNSSGIVPLGCTAYVTCTPKDAAGNDLPIAVHGPNALWAVVGEGVTVQTSQPSEPFNRDVRGLAAGVARLTCTVKGVQGALDLVIQ